MYNNIILHIPHSSSDFSLLRLSKCIVKDFQKQAKDLIDWYTDQLFTPAESDNRKHHLPDQRIIPVVFNTCRSLCDVERLSHDPLESNGMGIIGYRYMQIPIEHYERRRLQEPKRQTVKQYLVDVRLSPEERKKILHKYLDHQHHVSKLLINHPGALLLDCHSFSSRATALQPDTSLTKDIDICIGFNEDYSKPSPEVIDTVKKHFTELGYRVGINTPFSNAKTVDAPVKYHSLMIEINKSLYMNEDTLQKTENFGKVASDVQSLYRKLLNKQKVDITLPNNIRTPREILEYCDYDADQLKSALLKLSADEIRAMTWTIEDVRNIPTPMSRIVYNALYYGHAPSQKNWPDHLKKEFFDWIHIINF